jgi:type I restriction enzyme S subunit
MHIANGRIRPSKEMTVSTDMAAHMADFRLKTGDVVLGRRGEMGRCAVVLSREEGWLCGTGSLIVRPDPSALDPEYLQRFISSDGVVRYLLSASVGSTMANLNQEHLLALQVNLPPIAEQTRIVAKLEELLSDLDAGVAELKATKKKLAQYRQSLLKAAVEGALTAEWRAKNPGTETGAQLLARILTERRARWEAKQLAKFKEQGKIPPKDWQKKYPEPVQPDTTGLSELPEGWVWASVDCLLSDIETGKSFKCVERPPTAEEIGVVKVSAVSWGEYDEHESKTCTNEKRVNSALLVKAGDFLFSRANTVELVGACVIAKTISLKVMLSDKILRLVLVHEKLKPWLLYLLRSQIGRKQIEVLASGNQESMKNIGQERLRSIALPLGPKRELDHAITLVEQGLSSASQQLIAIEISLKQSAAQRQNILRAAFSGQLVPQDPNDEPASVLLARIRAERTQREADKKPRGRKPKEAT